MTVDEKRALHAASWAASAAHFQKHPESMNEPAQEHLDGAYARACVEPEDLTDEQCEALRRLIAAYEAA